MRRLSFPISLRLVFALLLCGGLACTHSNERADPSAESTPGFDPSKFVICRAQPGVSEYTHAVSLAASDKVLDLVRPPIDETARLSVRLDQNGLVQSVEVRSATAPGFGPLAAAALEMAAPYKTPPEDIARCIVGKSLDVTIQAQVDARCENMEGSTQWVLVVRDRIAATIDSPEYMAQPGEGYGYLRVSFGPKGQILQSQVNQPTNAQVADKIRRAVAQIGPLSPPPDWETCFKDQPVTLKIQASVDEP
jgi:hypothetical protein